ncbi:MAG TPA: hypothetical protein VFZ61_14500, partial [Polyangiales bacterium]
PKPDAQAPGSPEAGSAQEAGTSAEAGTTSDAGASFDAGGASDSGAMDATSGADAGSDASNPDAGTADSGGGTNDAGNTDAGSTDAGAVTFTRVYALFQAPCVGCHGASGRGGLNMANKNTAHMELTSPGNAEGPSCATGNRKRVVAGMPDMSLLIKKLEGTQDCGERMPEGRAPMTAAQIAEVRAWITAGAKND